MCVPWKSSNLVTAPGMIAVVFAGFLWRHLTASMYFAFSSRVRERLVFVNGSVEVEINLITYHSFLIIGFLQKPGAVLWSSLSCLSVRGALSPIDARARTRARAPVRLIVFMFYYL